jgi:hypothetical protein
MNTSGILIVSIFIIVIGLMSSGCTSTDQPIIQNSIPSTEPTIAQNSTPGSQGQERVSLQQAIDALYVSARNDGFTSSPGIYYIRAVNLTPNATAEEWTIGAMQGKKTYFFTFSRQSSFRTDWPNTLPYTAIQPGQFIQPADLFNNQSLLIQEITNAGTIDISELELENGVYTLSIDSGTNFKVLKFDAVTGSEL